MADGGAGTTDTGVFSAAGLIVPEPSIMLPPIPFIDDDGGCGAEYITFRGREVALLFATLVAPTMPVRQSARRGNGRAMLLHKQGDDC